MIPHNSVIVDATLTHDVLHIRPGHAPLQPKFLHAVPPSHASPFSLLAAPAPSLQLATPLEDSQAGEQA
ncbi:hypothetical protein NCC49_003509 [Naganishia albida]|nr:hypothetical protein NCC49_003509 [Naganishia albida]